MMQRSETNDCDVPEIDDCSPINIDTSPELNGNVFQEQDPSAGSEHV